MSIIHASLKWFKDNFYYHELATAIKNNRNIYSIMDEEAEKSPLCANGLLFLPYLSGERCPIWDPYAEELSQAFLLSFKKQVS